MGWVVIILGWGFVVMMGVYVFSFMSFVYFNLVVLLGMVVVGKFLWVYVILYSVV